MPGSLTRVGESWIMLHRSLREARGASGMGESDTDRLYRVVKNAEEQYSVWPADRELPPGWMAIGEPRSRDECLDHIDEIWTDMRPRSVREAEP